MSSTPPIPAVSVVLPTHNRRHRLERSIGSVLGQSFADFELIIVDDASTDDTESYIKGLTDPRVVYSKFAENRGQSAARNTGIRAARAPMVAFQDSDDEWVLDKLAVQVEAMGRAPDAVMVYGDLLRIPLSGEPFVIEAPELEVGRLFDHRSTTYATFGLGIQTCLFRREILLKFGGFEERLRALEDLELFLRITRRHKTLRLPRVLARYYETPGVSTTRSGEIETRKFLLRRYWLDILFHRRGWWRKEMDSIRVRRPLGA